MDERRSAEIIAFPRSRARAEPEPARQSPEFARARLLLALASLEAALSAQRSAVARWRGSIGELRGSMAGLGTSMHQYRDRLGALGTGVAALNDQARQLEGLSADRRNRP